MGEDKGTEKEAGAFKEKPCFLCSQINLISFFSPSRPLFLPSFYTDFLSLNIFVLCTGHVKIDDTQTLSSLSSQEKTTGKLVKCYNEA